MYIIYFLKYKGRAIHLFLLIIPASSAGQALSPKLKFAIPTILMSGFKKYFQPVHAVFYAHILSN